MAPGKEHKVYEKPENPHLQRGDTDDYAAILRAREYRVREAAVQVAEIHVMQAKLKACALRANIDAWEDCADLAQELVKMYRAYDKTHPTLVVYPEDVEAAKAKLARAAAK
mmetsp:Transcript_12195/g.20823  ORF Transcript_12195/g.20823 Transcript_12195/m.20823 type:complete len:111 (+) Transcript_12195:122-454(+)|eukprot:CAMPEP_0184691406 /NCGR_PEP_ID=MMETSP0313-20130426/269_1 /TAXON_ID=2792 /ORGANISM="Porphyridium aerugineum, Strain SAG 1380-2" /LENGTH=110 /DNA_ID=CAMNT_0027149111 /DNA_START=124 /DNA_END=456 /DNA_ORIENTATION=+